MINTQVIIKIECKRWKVLLRNSISFIMDFMSIFRPLKSISSAVSFVVDPPPRLICFFLDISVLLDSPAKNNNKKLSKFVDARSPRVLWNNFLKKCDSFEQYNFQTFKVEVSIFNKCPLLTIIIVEMYNDINASNIFNVSVYI